MEQHLLILIHCVIRVVTCQTCCLVRDSLATTLDRLDELCNIINACTVLGNLIDGNSYMYTYMYVCVYCVCVCVCECECVCVSVSVNVCV